MTKRRSPALAALLSFVFPGLGQAYAGHPGRGLVVALPVLGLIALLLLGLVSGPANLLGLLLRQDVLLALAAVNLGLLLYRVSAILDAYLLARPASDRRWLRGAAAALAVLLLVTAGMHGLAELYRGSTASGLATLFHDGQDLQDWTIPEPGWESPPPAAEAPTPAQLTPAGPAAVPATPTAQPTASPSPTPFDGPEWARDGRLNIVLLGSDEGPGRWSLRTDAVFLLSVDVESARAALFGFPRYMSNIPLPPESAGFYENGRFPGYLNAVYREAADRPRRFPGNDARGLRSVAGAVQELAGVRVDHYVYVNLNGFVDVVEAMGGLWIDIPERVRDHSYVLENDARRIRLDFRPGCQLLDGRDALAYARTRHQDSDYARMARQEHTLAAMRRQFDPLAVLPDLPHLFDVAGDNLFWSLQPADVVPMAQLAAKVDADRIQRVLFIPPEYPRTLPPRTVDAIRAKVRGIFDEPEPPPPSPAPAGERCPPD
ncbi:MAG TPA: LCP family protein [Candidatus Limnocylindria bacterium]|nr:LCP family protein [Candidatus Limnocylindria bacterium]